MSDQLSLNVKPLALLKQEDFRITISDDAITLKEQAIQASQKIKEITTVEQMESANPVLRLIKNTLKNMEEGRKIIKGPITKLGKDIDGIAQGYGADLESEEQRLKGLASAFLAKQQEAQVKEIRKTGETTIEATGGAGISTVEEWHFEILDEKKAYLASPGLFDLMPKANAIKAAAKAGFPMPHIKTWRTTGVRVKS
jgi:hypothetical protein